jgi:hypothetical protein
MRFRGIRTFIVTFGLSLVAATGLTHAEECYRAFGESPQKYSNALKLLSGPQTESRISELRTLAKTVFTEAGFISPITDRDVDYSLIRMTYGKYHLGLNWDVQPGFDYWLKLIRILDRFTAPSPLFTPGEKVRAQDFSTDADRLEILTYETLFSDLRQYLENCAFDDGSKKVDALETLVYIRALYGRFEAMSEPMLTLRNQGYISIQMDRTLGLQLPPGLSPNDLVGKQLAFDILTSSQGEFPFFPDYEDDAQKMDDFMRFLGQGGKVKDYPREYLPDLYFSRSRDELQRQFDDKPTLYKDYLQIQSQTPRFPEMHVGEVIEVKDDGFKIRLKTGSIVAVHPVYMPFDIHSILVKP